MGVDCKSCRYYMDDGYGAKFCAAPEGCVLDSTNDDYINGTGAYSYADEEDYIDKLISGLLDDE